MMGLEQGIYLIICIFFIITFTIYDFERRFKGEVGYILHYSGFLMSLLALYGVTRILGIENLVIVICAVYIFIYTVIYFKVKKIINERYEERFGGRDEEEEREEE